MKTREWFDADTDKVVKVYKSMQMPYDMPDMSNPLMKIRRVLESDAGEVIGGGAIKPIGECFLWVNPEMSAVLRARAFRRLAEDANQIGRQSGFDELSAWIPPMVEGDFANALLSSGWRMSPWRSWSRRI